MLLGSGSTRFVPTLESCLGFSIVTSASLLVTIKSIISTSNRASSSAFSSRSLWLPYASFLLSASAGLDGQKFQRDAQRHVPCIRTQEWQYTATPSARARQMLIPSVRRPCHFFLQGKPYHSEKSLTPPWLKETSTNKIKPFFFVNAKALGWPPEAPKDCKALLAKPDRIYRERSGFWPMALTAVSRTPKYWAECPPPLRH